jgi:cold shock protein
MANGTVVRFNEANGYGFITPDDGSDDVFLHASLLDGDYRENIPRGTRVSFEAVHSDRGPKAVSVSVIAPAPMAARPAGGGRADDPDDQLCDVVSTAEFSQKITEVLIGTVPTITGGQIMEVRTRLLDLARRHGWIED